MAAHYSVCIVTVWTTLQNYITLPIDIIKFMSGFTWGYYGAIMATVKPIVIAATSCIKKFPEEIKLDLWKIEFAGTAF